MTWSWATRDSDSNGPASLAMVPYRVAFGRWRALLREWRSSGLMWACRQCPGLPSLRCMPNVVEFADLIPAKEDKVGGRIMQPLLARLLGMQRRWRSMMLAGAALALLLPAGKAAAQATVDTHVPFSALA